MKRIVADLPITSMPSWAVWERRLIDDLSRSVEPFVEHFTRENGEFIWEDEWGGGSCDDFYEPFFNWSLLYLMGGADHMLSLADRQWEAITRQLTRLGAVHKEYGIREDNFHQSESDICFYNMCLADPQQKWRERAQRFAGFYLSEDPDAINYDPVHKIVMSCLNGSKGAYFPPESERESASYAPLGGSMERYSLPFFDLPGIEHISDLSDPAKAKQMGQANFDRWRRGDTSSNLSITSLVTNAFLMTGKEKYREWVVEYTDAWMNRTSEEGFIADNVGLSGEVGEYFGGKWYGGRHGWTFPHGFANLSKAFLDAGANAFLLTRDDDYLDLPRSQMDLLIERGKMRDIRKEAMSVPERWGSVIESMGEDSETFLIPMRYGDAGWFDWGMMTPTWPVALWNLSMADQDWERLEFLRENERHDWNKVFPFHSKEDAGHEQPWVRFLAGDNPTYPERMLDATHQIMSRRLELTRRDTDVGTKHHVHHWQWANPVSSEALVQLTLGGPQQLYNGGLLHARLRYYDSIRKRPGLPEDVAALVEKLERDRTVVQLVNLKPNESRELIVQAGAFGEHRFSKARWDGRTSEWPGELGGYSGSYAAPKVSTEERTIEIGSSSFSVELPPAMEIRLDLATERYVNEPSYSQPW